MKRFLEDLIVSSARLVYHIVMVGMSAAIALSLPIAVTFIAKYFLAYWSLIRNDRVFLFSIEMALTILFILLSSTVSRSWRDRKLSNIARVAGLVPGPRAKGLFRRRRMKRMKEKEGLARDVMIIGSTGYRTFVEPGGDLYNVMKNCREAKIMLLNPNGEGAEMRAKSIPNPDITPESFREEIEKSIAYLRCLKTSQKNIRLKLYDQLPLLKLTILGDYIWVQHYHAGLDVRSMPEYVFKHDQNTASLYIPFYQYFLTKWNDHNIPEYDFETEELVYRDSATPHPSDRLIKRWNPPPLQALGNPVDMKNPFIVFRGEQTKRTGGLPARGRELSHLNPTGPACETTGWMNIL